MRASYLTEAKYICVHAKKGKYECEAESSYGAAKKAAEHWGLKSTAGIDAHLADKPKTATEGKEGMMPNTQVRGVMPKQRKPYHKHKIKSDYEPETDLEEVDLGKPVTGSDNHIMGSEGHPVNLLKRVADQIAKDHADQDYTAIDELFKRTPSKELESFLSEFGESVQEKEDEEYDPRRVKADVVKHLVNMYNDAKKDGGYSSEKMHFALGNLLHDMDMAGYMNSDYFDIEGFFHKGIAKKQDYKVSMDMLRRAINQAKGLNTDTSVDPAVFKRGGSAMKSVATEDNPLPKNFFRMIATSDDPHGEIEGLMNAKGPAGDYIRRDYEITAGENGLHPDDDMEEIVDMMVQNYEDRRFEGMKNNKSMLGEVVKELTEEEFDEAAGKKDACYRKVKSRYKVWPSAYASGALVQCRKVGAANWGNKSKK